MHKPAVGHIYVLEMSDRTIKVGYSACPAERLMVHAVAAKKAGVSITRRWISPEHVEAGLNEKALIASCEGLGGTLCDGSRERFVGLRFEDVVSTTEDLAFTAREGAVRVTPGDIRRNFHAVLNDVAHHDAHVTIRRYDKSAAVLVPAEWHRRAEALMAKYGETEG